jgi:Protein of unknown function DUF262/Protein of unknown function (DUF1524)
VDLERSFGAAANFKHRIWKVLFVLTTGSLRLSELLSGPFMLNVPVYQRPYSWGTQQVQQLLDDLLESAGLGDTQAPDDSYFLGTILLMDSPGFVTTKLNGKLTPREFDVVDGQQRLVTLMTLCCILRDLDTKKALAKRVQGIVIAHQGSRFFRTERYRMHLSIRDRAVFEQHILKEGSTTERIETSFLSLSERSLISMRDMLAVELGVMSDETRSALFDFITDRCAIVVIVSHDIDKAHRTFVVLNERGKQLQRDDILKADILSRVNSADLNWIAETWDATGTALDKDFETFFSHIRRIYGSDNRQIVSGVRAVVADVGGAAPFMNTVFVPLARSYQLIKAGATSGLPPDITKRLRYLGRLSQGDWAPAAMLALKDWERDPERATLLIAEIDRMAHLMRLLCAGSGKRLRRFVDVITAIRSGEPIDETHPAFQLTREETRSIVFHLKDLHKRGPRICKLLLLRLGDIMDGKFIDVDPEHYSIEHILPQRPPASSDWRRLFPTAEDRGQFVESLGNLVLITPGQNDKARNASFEAKKTIYAETGDSHLLLPITADVLKSSEWRREEILAREARLLTMIANLWRIDIPTQKSLDPTSVG